ncbi:MAG: glycerophosphodiester phosphodiesterase family protein [Ginsengibacter sp.]
MRTYFYLLVTFTIIIFSCTSTNQEGKDASTFDKQAHRGGRGIAPENTIFSAKTAIDYDCTLEIDLQMSMDKKIVVSHDPYTNSKFCLTPEGDTMTPKEGQSRLLYHMNYDSIAKYDVGLKPNPEYPRQEKVPAIKPLLSVLIDSAEAYAKSKNHTNHYNIEIKSNPKNDGKNYSSVEEFVDLTMKIIKDKNIDSRTILQSFDTRVLNLVHEKYPGIKTAFLVLATNKNNAEGYINELGFIPDIFSPHFMLITDELIKEFHKKNVLVIPWTPNTLADLQRLKSMGVDGIITDYPDLFAQLK